jgi:transcriptional regulator with XRE-family HTH domain
MTDEQEPEWRSRADMDRDLLASFARKHAGEMADIEHLSDEDAAEHASEIRRILLGNEVSLCQKVAQLREERGWSQAELAKRLSAIGFEMHQTTVAKLEAGKRPLRVAETLALAQIFGLHPLAMFYMPFQGEDHGMEYMRARLRTLDETIEKTEAQIMRLLESFAKNYAEFSAQRLIVTDNMRRAAADHAKSEDDGEHQEAT